MVRVGASYSGVPRRRSACYESAGALGARRMVVTTGGRLAEMAPRRTVWPVIPLPGGFPATRGGRLYDGRGARVAALCGAGPRLTSEIDVAASHTEQLVAELGPGRTRGLACQDARPRPHGHDPGRGRAGFDDSRSHIAGRRRSTRTQSSRASRTGAGPSSTQRAGGWEGAGESGPFSRGVPRRFRRATRA